MMLLIEDIPGEPFFLIGGNFGDEHDEYEGYDFLATELMTQQELTLALFNLDSQPIYSRKIKLEDNVFIDGKHGYTQEDALRNLLFYFFVKDFNCFISPKKADGTEIIDAMIILEGFVVLIESKYVISDKATNKTQAINKAISQLDKAEKYLLENDIFNYKLITGKKIIKFVLGDSRLFNKIPKSILNSKTNLPIFISITSFTQLLGTIYIDNKDSFYQAFENQLLWFLEVNQPNKLCIPHATAYPV